MRHTTSNVIISITADGDTLFIKKGTKNGQTTARLATFLFYDRIPTLTTATERISADFKKYLISKLSRLRVNEFITITITTYKKERKQK